MLLDIQDFAQSQREHQELLNKEVALTYKQLCKTIEDIPTTEFDKFLNPKLKKEIERYYQHIEDGNYQNTLEIDITKNQLIKLYTKVNDSTAAAAYRDARTKAENCIYSIKIAEEIIIDGLIKRLYDYIKAADENFIIKTGDQIDFDYRHAFCIIIKYPTTELS